MLRVGRSRGTRGAHGFHDNRAEALDTDQGNPDADQSRLGEILARRSRRMSVASLSVTADALSSGSATSAGPARRSRAYARLKTGPPRNGVPQAGLHQVSALRFRQSESLAFRRQLGDRRGRGRRRG